MTLGEFLKQQRSQLNVSQADLAERMGIEQSYLSKLESDRSMPSSEIFASWLNSLNMSLTEVMNAFDTTYLQGKLRQIPQVAEYLNQRSAKKDRYRGAWLISCCFFIALSAPLFYLGFTKAMFSETLYEYQSPGVVLAGENPDIFRNWRSLHPNTLSSNTPAYEQYQLAQIQITERQNTHSLIIARHRGSQFNTALAANDGTSRTYYYKGEVQQPRVINSTLQAMGLFLFVLGMVGIVAEHKLFTRLF